MKMTLKNRIAQAHEILNNGDFSHCMDSNDKVVVFKSSQIAGSRLSARYNHILMNRNAVPLWWYEKSSTSDCAINCGFKKAYEKVVEYLEFGYDITPGRVNKLSDILSFRQDDYPKIKNDHNDSKNLRDYLRDLNNLRMNRYEMTNAEIYDFSFDMVYDFIDKLQLTKETLSLSFLIMYWIQRESDLIPLAVTCKKDEYLAALSAQPGEISAGKDSKKEFRLFMRKMLDNHLKLFIRNEANEKNTSRDRILELIKHNPKHTAKTMASCLGLTVSAVRKQLSILKDEARIKRIGPDKGGEWKFVKENNYCENDY